MKLKRSVKLVIAAIPTIALGLIFLTKFIHDLKSNSKDQTDSEKWHDYILDDGTIFISPEKLNLDDIKFLNMKRALDRLGDFNDKL